MIKQGIFRTEFFMFAKTKKQVLTDLFPHLNPIEFFRVLIESFPLVFVIYNFLKAVFLFDIRIFIMVNFAQKHVHRPAVHSKIPVHCLIYHTFFPRFCISRYAKDSVQVCVFLFFFRELFPLKMLHKIPIEQMLYRSILPDSSYTFSPFISAYCRNRPEQVLWPSAHFPKTSSQTLQENSPSRSNREIPWSSHSSNRSVSFSICSMSMDRICRQRKFFIFSRLVIVNPP